MRKVAISVGLAAVWAGFGRFLFAQAFLAERPGGATRLLLTRPGHHAIAADLRKMSEYGGEVPKSRIFLWRNGDKLI